MHSALPIGTQSIEFIDLMHTARPNYSIAARNVLQLSSIATGRRSGMV
jgi:hypothetical protein